ncbi:MAG: hypothetical protein EZS28_042347, partial [Streblomastix strix]
NNCLWRIDFQKVNGMVSKIPWSKQGDSYLAYDQKKAGMAEFTRLIIRTRELESAVEKIMKEDQIDKKIVFAISKVCGLCHEENDIKKLDTIALMKCGHSFHAECSSAWKSRGLMCPICDEPLKEL